jgi:glycosyltransferase involved in cell wall biosynthesis
VVVSEFGPTTLRALAWCRLHRRPLVILTEVTSTMAEELSAGQRRLHGWLARRAAGFVAVSSAARARVEALGVPADRIEVSLQSADLVPLEAASAHRRPPPPPVRLLTVARLVEDKNVGRLLEAVARTGHGPEALELEVCGTGPLEAELRARAEHLGVAVRFAGYVSPAGLAAHYARAHAFALISTYEPFGVAVREAAAAGLPIVCSRRAGAAGDLAVSGRNALLVDPTRTEEIADALDRIVRDSRLREELTAGSRAISAATPLGDGVAAFERAVLRATGRLRSAA